MVGGSISAVPFLDRYALRMKERLEKGHSMRGAPLVLFLPGGQGRAAPTSLYSEKREAKHCI